MARKSRKNGKIECVRNLDCGYRENCDRGKCGRENRDRECGENCKYGNGCEYRHKDECKPESVMKVYRTVLYVRLSEEDERKVASDSIENQIAFLKDFLADKLYLKLIRIYVDRNVSGTTFERPEFKKMMADMKRGMFDCIVVKDLSRLGRNYLEMGDYLESIFPFMGIRFIAVNDHYDSLVATPDQNGFLVPLKNLINEAYARDIAVKVATVRKMQQMQGLYIGGIPAYGYMRDPDDRHHLVVDENVRAIVERIFSERVAGKSMFAIARDLNIEGILAPVSYRIQQGFKINRKKESFWNSGMIKRIITNRVYIGEIVAHEENLFFPDMHEAIVSREIYDQANKLVLDSGKRAIHIREKYRDVEKKPGVLKGLLFCMDCGNKMTLKRQTRQLSSGLKTYYRYKCDFVEVYRGIGHTAKKVCMEDLEALVAFQIRTHISMYLFCMEKLRKSNRNEKVRAVRRKYEEELRACKGRISYVKRLLLDLYDDFADGILSQRDYLEMKRNYGTERDKLEERVNELESVLETYDEEFQVDGDVQEQMERFVGFEELTEEIVRIFISRINCYSKDRFEFVFAFQNQMDQLEELNKRREDEMEENKMMENRK